MMSLPVPVGKRADRRQPRDPRNGSGEVGAGDQGGGAERKDDAGGDRPVVSYDEVPDNRSRDSSRFTRAAPPHRRGSRSHGSNPAPQREDHADRGHECHGDDDDEERRVASWPVRTTPPPQKTPNELSITATPNFIVFSGTRASWARAATPARMTGSTATPAAAAARPTWSGHRRRSDGGTMLADRTPQSTRRLRPAEHAFQPRPGRLRKRPRNVGAHASGRHSRTAADPDGPRRNNQEESRRAAGRPRS